MQLQRSLTLTKLAGSGSRSGVGSEFRVRSESVSQRYRSVDLDPDPDPYQSVTDPKHLFVLIKTYQLFTRRLRNRLVNWLKFYYRMRICAFKVKLVIRCVEINWFQTKLVQVQWNWSRNIADSDLHGPLLLLVGWIQIPIRTADPDSGQIWRTKIKKRLRNFMFWFAGCSLLRALGLSCSSDFI